METRTVEMSYELDSNGEFIEKKLDSEELILDIDDLSGILDQLEAIHLGYADPISYFEFDTIVFYCKNVDSEDTI